MRMIVYRDPIITGMNKTVIYLDCGQSKNFNRFIETWFLYKETKKTMISLWDDPNAYK